MLKPLSTNRFRNPLVGVAVALAAVSCSSGSVPGVAAVDAAPAVAAPDTTSPNSPAPSAAVDAGTVDRIITLETADGRRSAIVHHPAGLPAGAPLVVVLHPAATSAQTMQANYGWDAVADRNGFVTVYPEGLLDLYQDTWNGGTCCPPASQLQTDDLGFLDAVVAGLRRYDAIGARVYAVGFSNGGIMAYAWACHRPGLLTGIGVVAGAVATDCGTPSPLTVVAVHGTADPSIPIGGGPGPDGSTFPSLDTSLAPFRQAASCPSDPVVAATDEAVVSTWSCANGRRIVRDLVTGLDHAWPGGGPGAGAGTGPADATGFVWDQLTR